MNRIRELKFKAVIFDMDGVITNTMPYHFDVWAYVFSLVGIKVDCYDIYCREGQDGLSTIKEIYKKYNKRFNLRQAKRLLSKKQDLFKRTVKLRFVKGSRPFIKDLKKRKFKLGLVTGTSRRETETILPRDLYCLFDVVITGDEVKKGKPNPQPFLKSINAINIPNRQAVVIENAPFGIQAAKQADLFCIALQTSLPKRFLTQADIICESFEDLRQKLRFKRAGNGRPDI